MVSFIESNPLEQRQSAANDGLASLFAAGRPGLREAVLARVARPACHLTLSKIIRYAPSRIYLLLYCSGAPQNSRRRLPKATEGNTRCGLSH